MKRTIWVDLNDAKSAQEQQKILYNMWGFSNLSIESVFEKYRGYGQVIKFSKENYIILKELIQLYVESHSKEENEAFLASNKSRLRAFYNTESVKTALTVISAIVPTSITSAADWGTWGWDNGVAIFLWLVWIVLNCFNIMLSGSQGKYFYQDLFESVSDNRCKADS